MGPTAEEPVVDHQKLIYWPAPTFATRAQTQQGYSATSTDGITPGASNIASAGSHPPTMRLPGTPGSIITNRPPPIRGHRPISERKVSGKPGVQAPVSHWGWRDQNLRCVGVPTPTVVSTPMRGDQHCAGRLSSDPDADRQDGHTRRLGQSFLKPVPLHVRSHMAADK